MSYVNTPQPGRYTTRRLTAAPTIRLDTRRRQRTAALIAGAVLLASAIVLVLVARRPAEPLAARVPAHIIIIATATPGATTARAIVPAVVPTAQPPTATPAPTAAPEVAEPHNHAAVQSAPPAAEPAAVEMQVADEFGADENEWRGVPYALPGDVCASWHPPMALPAGCE